MATTATTKPAAKAETNAPAAQTAANSATTTSNSTAAKEPPMLPADKPTPAPFSDPDQFRESIAPAAPISERLERLEFLNSLCTQRDEVTEAIEKLQRFNQSPHGGQQIIFRGAGGESTATHHPIVIEAMVEVATSKLKAKLREIEMQILL